MFLCINLYFWQILKYTNFVWTDKKTSVTARNEKDPRSRLESPRKPYFEGLAFNSETTILTICWHSSVEQVCHQLLTVTDRFIFATAYPHPLRYGSTHKPTLDFFVRSRGCLWGRWSLIGLGLLLLLSSLWPWCWVASLRMTQVTPVERRQEPNINRGQITDDSGSRTGKFLNLFSVIRWAVSIRCHPPFQHCLLSLHPPVYCVAFFIQF